MRLGLDAGTPSSRKRARLLPRQLLPGLLRPRKSRSQDPDMHLPGTRSLVRLRHPHSPCGRPSRSTSSKASATSRKSSRKRSKPLSPTTRTMPSWTTMSRSGRALRPGPRPGTALVRQRRAALPGANVAARSARQQHRPAATVLLRAHAGPCRGRSLSSRSPPWYQSDAAVFPKFSERMRLQWSSSRHRGRRLCHD